MLGSFAGLHTTDRRVYSAQRNHGYLQFTGLGVIRTLHGRYFERLDGQLCHQENPHTV